MKKTLIITLEYPPVAGGIASYIHGLAQALDPNKTVVLAPNHPDAASWDAGVPYRLLRRTLLLPRWFWPRWLMLFFTVRQIVRTEGIECFMVHHVLPVGYVAWLMRKLYRIPYLVFFHGTDLTMATKSSWKTSLASQVLGGAEQVIGNSQSLLERLHETLPVAQGRTTLMYPCPDELFFAPGDTDHIMQLYHQYALEGKRVLVSVSRLGDGKGFPHLIRLIPDILSRIPNLVWLVVGDGPKRPYLVQEIQRMQLQNVVRLVGAMPLSDIPAHLRLGEVFVLLTHWDEARGQEGFGLAFVEASAVGLPVVAGKSGGVVEAVEDGVTGRIVDSAATTPVIDAICELFTDDDERKRLADQGRARAEDVFRWRVQVKKLEPWIGTI